MLGTHQVSLSLSEGANPPGVDGKTHCCILYQVYWLQKQLQSEPHL